MRTLIRSKAVTKDSTKCTEEEVRTTSVKQMQTLIKTAVSASTGTVDKELVKNSMVDIIELIHVYTHSVGIDPGEIGELLLERAEKEGNIVGFTAK